MIVFDIGTKCVEKNSQMILLKLEIKHGSGFHYFRKGRSAIL